MPAAGDADAFDLSAILDGNSGQTTPPPLGSSGGRGGFVPAFTFPGTDAPDPDGSGEVRPSQTETIQPAPPQRSVAEAARPPGDGWRVRNATGVTYEMVSVESVIQWLQTKDSFDGIRIARGSSAFRTVEDYPELMARMGMRSGSGDFSGDDAAPMLDLESAPRQPVSSKAPPTQRAEGRGATRNAGGSAPSGQSPAAGRAPAKSVVQGPTYGMGLTLILLAGALVVSVAVLFGISALGLGGALAVSSASTPPAVSSDEAPVGPGLRVALDAFEAERFTAAEQLLLQAARTEKGDPRVYRYLALTLSKLGGRDREARAALAQYRRARLGAGGD